jgi:uncharacterized protein
MKSRLLIILLIASVILTNCHLTDNRDSLVWEISGNGMTVNSYLFGTFHYIPVQAFYFPFELHKLIKKTDVILMEANPAALDSLYRKQNKEIAYLPEGKTYADYLSPEAFQDFNSFLIKDLGLNDSIYKIVIRLKPMYAETKIVRLYFGPLKSYEYYLKNLADGYEKQIIGLDSKEQIKDYSNRYFEQDNPSLFWKANDSSGFKKLRGYKKLVRYYLHQRIEALDSLMQADSDFPNTDSIIMVERNIRWAKEISGIIMQKPSFIAVGARHLSGKNSLINRLRKEHFKVKPLII